MPRIHSLSSNMSFAHAIERGGESKQRVQASVSPILGEEGIIQQTIEEGERIGLSKKALWDEIQESLDEESDVEMVGSEAVSAACEGDLSPLFLDSSEDETKPPSRLQSRSIVPVSDSGSNQSYLKVRIRLGSVFVFSSGGETETRPPQYPELGRINENDVMGWTHALLGISPSQSSPPSHPEPVVEKTPRTRADVHPAAEPPPELFLPPAPSSLLPVEEVGAVSCSKEEDLIPLLKRFFSLFPRPKSQVVTTPARKARFVLLVREEKQKTRVNWMVQVRRKMSALTGEEAGQNDFPAKHPFVFIHRLSSLYGIQNWFDPIRTTPSMLQEDLMHRIDREERSVAVPLSKNASTHRLFEGALESEFSEVLATKRKSEEDLMALLTLFFKTQPTDIHSQRSISPERKARLVLSIRQAKLEGKIRWGKRVREILESFGGRDHYWRDPYNSSFILHRRLFIKEWFDPLTFPMKRLEQDAILRIRNEIGKLAAR